MKLELEIDFSDVVHDGRLTDDAYDNILTKMSEEILHSFKAREEILKAVKEKVSEKLVREIDEAMVGFLDKEYEEVDQWGVGKKTWTLRSKFQNEIKKAIHYEPTISSRERNSFSKMVEKMMAKQFKEFEKHHWKEIDSKFMAECMEYASKKLNDKIKGT